MPTIEIIPNWHPLIVHFTIALLLTAAAMFVLGAAFARRPLGPAVTLVARWNLALGIVAAILALVTGWQAYNTVTHDEPSHGNMVVHLRWALGAAGLFIAAAAAAWFDRRRAAGGGLALLALLAVASGALFVTGWIGGENVYRYGLGVLSLPTVEGHQHPGVRPGQVRPGPEASQSGEGQTMGDMPGMPGHSMTGGGSPPAPNPATTGSASSAGGHAHQ